MSLANFLQKGKDFLTPRNSSDSGPRTSGFIFPSVNKEIDGEDCDHDCETCEVNLPKGWKIDHDEKLYGHVNGWATHMLVATGKNDWVKDVSDEKGSVMEAVRDCKVEPSNGVSPTSGFVRNSFTDTEDQKLMLSASNLPVDSHDSHPPAHRPTTILLLPAFTFVDNVTPHLVPTLINHHISPAPTTTTPLSNPPNKDPIRAQSESQASLSVISCAESGPFTTRPCPHKYLILMCSQRTRDARCGQSAPLLKREFERQLRPLGLYRDMYDERPGGVGIYFISHVGGHKFAANVMVYRRVDAITKGASNGDKAEPEAEANGNEAVLKKREIEKMGEGAQCIWLARVRPEDCEGIIKYTVLQGKVVKPQSQLRGGFDREKGLVSW